MTYEQKPLECCAFKSDRFENAFDGHIEVEGKQYWANIYEKQGKNGKFLVLKLKSKDKKIEEVNKDSGIDDSNPF